MNRPSPPVLEQGNNGQCCTQACKCERDESVVLLPADRHESQHVGTDSRRRGQIGHILDILISCCPERELQVCAEERFRQSSSLVRRQRPPILGINIGCLHPPATRRVLRGADCCRAR